MKLFVVVMLVGLVGCHRHSAPLGTLKDTSAWTSDCEAPIVKEDPRAQDALGPTMRDGGPAFVRATQRYRCSPPGWAIYTDSDDRIVGFCVDDDTRPYVKLGGSFRDSVDHETDRARRLIATHWGVNRAIDMLRGASGDHCAVTSESVVGGMSRWGMSQFVYPEPEKIRSINMCCWELGN